MLPITNLSGETELVTNIKTIVRSRKVNGEKTIKFISIPDKDNIEAFDYVNNESTTIFKGEPYIIKKINEKSVGEMSIKSVDAIHTFFNTMINCYQYDLHSGSQTFFAALTRVFTPTPYSFVIVDSFTAETFENFGRDNCLSLLQNVLSRYGSEFEVIGNTVYFKRMIGANTGFQLRWKSNIKSIDKQVDTDSLATVIRGFGGKPNEETGVYPIDVEYRSPNEELFGEWTADAIYNENLSTSPGMMAHLEKILVDEPQLSITVDIAEIDGDVKNEGDRGYIIYEPMKLKLEARVVEIIETFEYIGGKWTLMKTDVTLSNLRNKLTDVTTRFAQTSKTLNRILEGQQKLPFSSLDEAVKNATLALQSAQTELEFSQGIIARDPTDPNRLVLFNSAGMGISLNGGETFQEAITYLGVNTSLLTAGQINANNINIKGGTVDSYSLIDANGLYVKGGAISIERPDGFVVIDNGISSYDFSVVGGTPCYIENDGTVLLDNQYYSTNSTSYKRFDYCKFKHTSLYVFLDFYGLVQNGLSRMSVIVEDELGERLAFISTENGIDTNIPIQINLGVPTGQTRYFYLKYKTDNNAYKASLRLAARFLWG